MVKLVSSEVFMEKEVAGRLRAKGEQSQVERVERGAEQLLKEAAALPPDGQAWAADVVVGAYRVARQVDRDLVKTSPRFD
ncbi:MAG: hypothetical protein ACFFDT_35910 [Candidatus Hodarchaeota archaeon]